MCTQEHSTEQCISSAKAVISYLKAYPEHFDHLMRWRTLVSYAFSAVCGIRLLFGCEQGPDDKLPTQIIVLFMDLCHHRQGKTSSVESKRKELEEALAVFRCAIHVDVTRPCRLTLLRNNRSGMKSTLSQEGANVLEHMIGMPSPGLSLCTH